MNLSLQPCLNLRIILLTSMEEVSRELTEVAKKSEYGLKNVMIFAHQALIIILPTLDTLTRF